MPKSNITRDVSDYCESMLITYEVDEADFESYAKYHGVSVELMEAMLEVGQIVKLEKIQARYESENKSITFLE